jgi:hypothetical protein
MLRTEALLQNFTVFTSFSRGSTEKHGVMHKNKTVPRLKGCEDKRLLSQRD